VLTIKITSSAREMLAATLQSHHRTTIMGEQTDGGANAGASYTIHPHFEAFIPSGRTIDTSTGNNWESCGVTPDIVVSPEESFNLAYNLALQSIREDLGKATSGTNLSLRDEGQSALGDLV
jgi:C-terminal processing protease CtpA/Prc